MRFLHTVKHFWIVSYCIISYRDILCDIVSYRVPYGCIVPSLILEHNYVTIDGEGKGGNEIKGYSLLTTSILQYSGKYQVLSKVKLV